MSTILDALRKAQAKHEEDEGEDAVEHGASDAVETLHADSTAPDIASTFDDVAPPDRVAAAAQRPNLVAAVGVGLVGLALGIGAARVAGQAFFGAGGKPVQVATETTKSKPAKAADGKKSPALPGPETAEETHAQREARAHGTRAPKAEKGAHENAADEILDPDAQPEDASAPAGSAPAPLGATPPSAPIPGAVASAQNVPPLAPAAPRAMPPASAGFAPELPPPAVFGGAVAVGPDNTIVPAPPRNAPDAAAAPVEHVPPLPADPVQMAALTPPVNAVPGGVPGEPAVGTVLETPPTGSPEVSLLFIKWSHDALRRVASLRGPGGKLLLVHEGDIVEGMRVSLIRADSVELQWRGSNFLLYAAR